MTADGGGWKPDWVVAPALVLAEWLEEYGMSVTVVAATAVGRRHRDFAAAKIQAVLDREPLTEECADILARGTRVPARFWLGLEHNYRAGLAAGLIDTEAP